MNVVRREWGFVLFVLKSRYKSGQAPRTKKFKGRIYFLSFVCPKERNKEKAGKNNAPLFLPTNAHKDSNHLSVAFICN